VPCARQNLSAPAGPVWSRIGRWRRRLFLASTKAHVLRQCEILGRGGGFVFNPVHNIQASVPVENVLAAFRVDVKYLVNVNEVVSAAEQAASAGTVTASALPANGLSFQERATEILAARAARGR